MFNLKKKIKKLVMFFNYYFFFYSNNPKFFNIKKKDSQIFFGYHDKINFNISNKILFHQLESRKSSSFKAIKVGYYDLNQKKFYIIGSSKAWSWQLGTQLQWSGIEENVIFNSFKNNKPVSLLFSTKKNCFLKQFSFHVYNVDKEGKLGIFTNFIRLGKFRDGYGYFNKNNKEKFDGFRLIKLSNYKQIRCYRIIDICNKIDYFYNDKIYLNHFTFSPDSKKISFYLIDNSKQFRFNNLILYDIYKNEFEIIKKLNQVSHFSWKNNNEAILTSSKNLIDFDLIIYNFKNKKIKKFNKFTNSKDFHMMVHPLNENLIVLDGYPNLKNIQKLLVLDLKKKRITFEKSILSHYGYDGPSRCDLHAKWSHDGKYILVDTTENKKREIKIIPYH